MSPIGAVDIVSRITVPAVCQGGRKILLTELYTTLSATSHMHQTGDTLVAIASFMAVPKEVLYGFADLLDAIQRRSQLEDLRRSFPPAQ